jgi:diguanylate cyclase (GGDEF)-like protein
VARGRPAARRSVVVVQVVVDTVLSAWVVAVGAPAAGLDAVIWPLLLMPVAEAAMRFRIGGAIATMIGGIVTVHLLAGPRLSPRDIAEQVVLLGVALAIGLISEVLAARLAALSRARRETSEHAALLTAVATAARKVTALDPQRVLEAVTEAALELGFDMAEICVLTDDGATIAPVVQRGWPPHHPPSSQPADSGVAGQAVGRGQLVVVPDYQSWEHALDVHLSTGIARSAASAPIRDGDRVVAVLTVANHAPRDLTSYERDCLELLATQAGVALQNAHAYVEGQVQRAELQRRVVRDPLTGVANREHAMRVLEERCGRTATGAEPPTVLFVDLDDLKAVNDTHGHRAGDEIIRAVASRMTDAVRPEDVVARIGGDEFLVILATAPEDAGAIAERILDAVRCPVELDDRLSLTPSISIGAATRGPDESIGGLLSRADAAMYRAKDDPTGSFALA